MKFIINFIEVLTKQHKYCKIVFIILKKGVSVMKVFTAKSVGNEVMAVYGDRKYVLMFETSKMAKTFVKELEETQRDFWENGKNRKKAMDLNLNMLTVRMNFNKSGNSDRWTMVATMTDKEQLKCFYEDLRYAIWGPIP